MANILGDGDRARTATERPRVGKNGQASKYEPSGCVVTEAKSIWLTCEVRGRQKAQPFGCPLDRRVRALVAKRHDFGGGRHGWPKHTTARLELGDGTTAPADSGPLDERRVATEAERRLSGAPNYSLHKRAKRNPLTDSSKSAKRGLTCIEGGRGTRALLSKTISSNTRERSNV